MYLQIGDHRFSMTDARRTLLHALDVLDGFPVAARPWQADRRSRVATVVDGLDLRAADLDAMSEPLTVVWRELLGARADLLAAESLPPRQTGRVAWLGRSCGGVPNLPVERVDVDHRGVVGDRQATRRHHGAPFQALCIWHLGVIEGLAAQGHPIAPGSAAENVTIAGVDWAAVQPGIRLQLGSVLCEVSSDATPCRQNARWFTDGDVTRIDVRNGALSRMYATVLEPGVVALGDPVVVEPD